MCILVFVLFLTIVCGVSTDIGVFHFKVKYELSNTTMIFVCDHCEAPLEATVSTSAYAELAFRSLRSTTLDQLPKKTY